MIKEKVGIVGYGYMGVIRRTVVERNPRLVLAGVSDTNPRTREKIKGCPVFDSFEELLERLQFFENNPEAYKIEVNAQRAKLNRLCFERPLKELFSKHEEKLVRIGVNNLG